MTWSTDAVDFGVTIRAMPLDDIATFVRENYELNIVKGDLNPQDKMITIYITMIQAIKPDMNNPTQIPFEALTSIERLEAHEQYMMFRNVFDAMKQFLESMHYTDFVFEDIVAPKTRRTQTILSNIISFLAFCDSRFEKTSQLDNLLAETEKKRNELASSEPLLQRRKNNAKVDLITAEQNYIQIQKEFEEINAKLEVKIDERDIAHKGNAEKKLLITTLKQDLETKANKLNEQQKQSDHLETRIARSPEELQAVIAARNDELAHLKAEIHTKRAQLVQLADKNTNMENWKSKVTKTLKVTVAISKQLEFVRSLQSSYTDLQYKGKSIRNEIADAQANLEDLQGVLMLYREKWDTVEVQHQLKINAKQTLLEQAEKHKEMLEKNSTETDIVVESLLEELEQLSTKISKQEEKLELGAHPAEYFNLLETLDVYHLKLAEHIQKLMKAAENLKQIDLNFKKNEN